MAKIIQPGQRLLTTIPYQLDTTKTSGSKQISLPFPVGYIGVINPTTAAIAVEVGERGSQSPEAIQLEPGVYLAFPIEETQKVTIFWTSQTPPSATNNQMNFIFSNEEIQLSGGPMSTGGVSSNVQVTNAPNVNIQTMPNLTVTSQPPNMGSDYGSPAANHTMKVDGNGLQYVALEKDDLGIAKDSSLTNINTTLGTLAKDSTAQALAKDTTVQGIENTLTTGSGAKVQTTNGAQAATSGIVSTNQISVGTAATVLFNGVVNGKQIVIGNVDQNNKLYVGAAGVTTTTGYPIPPGGSFTLDIVPGSTITIYGVAAATLTAPIMTIN